MDLVAQDLTPVSTKGAKDLVLMDLEMAAAPEMAGASITKRMKANVDEDGGCKGSRWSASGIVETSRFDYNDYNSVFFNDNFFLNNQTNHINDNNNFFNNSNDAYDVSESGAGCVKKMRQESVKEGRETWKDKQDFKNFDVIQ